MWVFLETTPTPGSPLLATRGNYAQNSSLQSSFQLSTIFEIPLKSDDSRSFGQAQSWLLRPIPTVRMDKTPTDLPTMYP